MKKIAIAALAFGALATTFAPGAYAHPPAATDGCGFTSATDPNPEAPDNTQTGYVYGGPIQDNGTLTCTIKAGVGTHAGTTPNSATASATGTNGTTFLAPTIVSYTSPPETNVYACDKFVHAGDGITYVYDASQSAWVDFAANPGATCSLAIGTGTDDPIFDPINDLIEDLDPTICTLLLAPLNAVLGDPDGILYVAPDGDVYVLGDWIWDCPPYIV